MNRHNFVSWLHQLQSIPFRHVQSYRNTDRVNVHTMEEVYPGVTRVYEMTFVAAASRFKLAPKSNTTERYKSKIDVVIVAGYSNCVLEKTVQRLRSLLVHVGNIYVITLSSAVKTCKNIVGVSDCLDENKILDRIKIKLDSRNEKGWQAERGRRSWYYQQLLKLLVYQSIALSEDFLIWDADVLLVKPYTPYDGHKVRFGVQGNENIVYRDATQSLIGLKVERSGIVVHQMLIKKRVLENMIAFVCGSHVKEDCANEFLDKIPLKSNAHYGLSEYQLYHAWFAHFYPREVRYDENLRFKRLNTGRKGLGTDDECRKIETIGIQNLTMLVVETKTKD